MKYIYNSFKKFMKFKVKKRYELTLRAAQFLEKIQNDHFSENSGLIFYILIKFSFGFLSFHQRKTIVFKFFFEKRLMDGFYFILLFTLFCKHFVYILSKVILDCCAVSVNFVENFLENLLIKDFLHF